MSVDSKPQTPWDQAKMEIKQGLQADGWSLVSFLSVAAFVFFGGLLYAIATLEKDKFGDLGLIAVVGDGLVSIGSMSIALVFLVPRLVRGFRKSDVGKVFPLAFGVIIVTTGAFGELCRELYIQFGGFSGVQTAFPFTHYIPGNSPWVKFAASWLLNTFTFNASQLFGWMTTPIQATAWWSRSLIVLFSLASGLVLFSAVISMVRWAIATVTSLE
jgi:hypothetical protein